MKANHLHNYLLGTGPNCLEYSTDSYDSKHSNYNYFFLHTRGWIMKSHWISVMWYIRRGRKSLSECLVIYDIQSTHCNKCLTSIHFTPGPKLRFFCIIKGQWQVEISPALKWQLGMRLLCSRGFLSVIQTDISTQNFVLIRTRSFSHYLSDQMVNLNILLSDLSDWQIELTVFISPLSQLKKCYMIQILICQADNDTSLRCTIPWFLG